MQHDLIHTIVPLPREVGFSLYYFVWYTKAVSLNLKGGWVWENLVLHFADFDKVDPRVRQTILKYTLQNGMCVAYRI